MKAVHIRMQDCEYYYGELGKEVDMCIGAVLLFEQKKYQISIDVVDSVLLMNGCNYQYGFKLYFKNSCVKFKKCLENEDQIYFAALLKTGESLYKKFIEQRFFKS